MANSSTMAINSMASQVVIININNMATGNKAAIRSMANKITNSSSSHNSNSNSRMYLLEHASSSSSNNKRP